MIVLGMNPQDLVKEYERDYDEMCDLISADLLSRIGKIKKIYSRTKSPIPIIDRKLKIRGTNYIIPIRDITEPDDVYKSNILIHPYIITNDKVTGNKVVLFFINMCHDYKEITIPIVIEPYLLSRYRERFLKKEPGTISYEELASMFLKRNRSFFNLSYSSVFDDNGKVIDVRTMSKVVDGVVFGRIEPNGLVRFLTYINHELVRESDQKEYLKGEHFDNNIEFFKDPEMISFDIIKYF